MVLDDEALQKILRIEELKIMLRRQPSARDDDFVQEVVELIKQITVRLVSSVSLSLSLSPSLNTSDGCFERVMRQGFGFEGWGYRVKMRVKARLQVRLQYGFGF